MELNLDIKVDPEKIRTEVVSAIIASSFGDSLSKAIDNSIKQLGSPFTWNNELEKWIKEEMRKIVFDTVKNTYGDKIREQIATSITPEVISKLVTKISEEVCYKINIDH